MGFLSTLFGGDQAKAAKGAARAQSESIDRAIAESRRASSEARADLQPFRAAGQSALPGLTSLVTDPDAQRKFVMDSPFYGALADDAQSRLFANQAARGKVGSGGTADALQTSLLRLGTDLVDRGIGQRQNLASLGANAAAGQASNTLNTGATIGNLLTTQGDVRGAGQIGAANARSDGLNNVISTGLGIGKLLTLSDKRTKAGAKKVGKLDNGLNVYTYRYKGEEQPHIGVMAQEVEKVRPGAVHTVRGIKLVDLMEAAS